MLTETLLKQPGFLYKSDRNIIILEWMRECTRSDASNCVMMYHILKITTKSLTQICISRAPCI